MKQIKFINGHSSDDPKYAKSFVEHNITSLTFNKIYNIIDEDNSGYLIENDKHLLMWYIKWRFIDVTRKMKLERILK